MVPNIVICGNNIYDVVINVWDGLGELKTPFDKIIGDLTFLESK